MDGEYGGGGMSKKDQQAFEAEMKKLRRQIDLMLTSVKEKEHAQRLKSMIENVSATLCTRSLPRFVFWISVMVGNTVPPKLFSLMPEGLMLMYPTLKEVSTLSVDCVC